MFITDQNLDEARLVEKLVNAQELNKFAKSNSEATRLYVAMNKFVSNETLIELAKDNCTSIRNKALVNIFNRYVEGVLNLTDTELMQLIVQHNQKSDVNDNFDAFKALSKLKRLRKEQNEAFCGRHKKVSG